MKDGENELGRWLAPNVFRALADPNRVALLVRLAQCRGEQIKVWFANHLTPNLANLADGSVVEVWAAEI